MALNKKDLDNIQSLVKEFLVPGISYVVEREMGKYGELKAQIDKVEQENQILKNNIEDLKKLVGSKLLKKLMEG